MTGKKLLSKLESVAATAVKVRPPIQAVVLVTASLTLLQAQRLYSRLATLTIPLKIVIWETLNIGASDATLPMTQNTMRRPLT